MHFEDKLLIQELVFRCARHVDLLETEEWVATFSPDGVLDDREFGFGLHVGHDQLRSFGRSYESSITHQAHLLTNILITDVTATSARSTFNGFAESMGPALGHFRCHILYEDKYEKMDGEWKIKSRTLRKTFPVEVIDEPA